MNLLRLLAVESSKARRRKSSLSTLAFSGGLAVVFPQVAWLAGDAPETGYYVFARALGHAYLLGSLLVIVHAAVAVAAERHDRTLRNVLSGPVSRLEVALSRWVALLLTAFLLVVLVAACAWGSTAIHFSFGDVYGDAIEPLAAGDELRRYSFVAIAYIVPAIFALASVGFLISCTARTAAGAAGVAIGVFFFFEIVKSVLPGSSGATRYLWNSYLPALFDRTSYLAGVIAFADGRTDVLWLDDSVEHLCVWAVPGITALGCAAIGIALFVRRDVTE